jgi:two-component system, CAI-1 autoinducer sensor kinase/phosphatase CqsS
MDPIDSKARKRYRMYLRARDAVVRVWRRLFEPELEPALHATPWRLRLTALFVMIGNPLAAWVWSDVAPQGFEDSYLRLAISALAVPLLFMASWPEVPHRVAVRYFVLLSWVQIPLLFLWMLWANVGNEVWLATCAAGVVVYYQLKDWRMATMGVVLAIVAVTLGAAAASGVPLSRVWMALSAGDVFVLGFFWAVAMGLAISHADLRATQLHSTLATVGIMAHELRTPLATVSMIGDALRGESDADAAATAERQAEMGRRLHVLVRAMHHQIDTQIANASLAKPVPIYETVSAQAVARQALMDFPFTSARQRDAVKLKVQLDFTFLGAMPIYVQVLTNLLKNALHAVSKTGRPWAPGDVEIEVRREGERGFITLRDTGVGMDAYVQKHMFEPFFSTRAHLGHGLGLAFCDRAVRAGRGHIRVLSEPGAGSVFVVELPTANSWDRPSV